MATGDSFAALTRQSKRGVTPTAGSGAPPASAVKIGEVDESAPVKPGVAGGSFGQARTPRFADPFAAIAVRSSPEPEPVTRKYGEGASAFDALASNGKVGERTARRDISAIKLLTRLVQGIAFKPGSGSSDAVKSDVLGAQLLQVGRLSAVLAQAVEPGEAHRPWVRAQCAEMVGELLARRSEEDHFGEPLDIESAVRAVCDMLAGAGDDIELAEALDVTKSGRYMEVAGSDADSIARSRLSVSLAGAVWDLYDKVTSPRLGSGNFRFTYGRPAEEIVKMLSRNLVATARESEIEIGNPDLQIAHLQGSVRRLAGLIGAEYVSRTRETMNWICEDGIDDATYRQRQAMAEATFEAKTLPDVLQTARRSFLLVERVAPAMIAATFLHQATASQDGDDGSSSHAGQGQPSPTQKAA